MNLWADGEIWYHISFAPRSSGFESPRVQNNAVVAYAFTSNWWRLTSAGSAGPVIPKLSTTEMWAPRFVLCSVSNEEKNW